MPTYEYECKSCGHSFEVFQSMSDAPLKDCPECTGEIRRLIFGGAGVIFKGSGFYVTDKSKPSKTEAKSSKSGDSTQKTDGGSVKSDSAQPVNSATASKPQADTPKRAGEARPSLTSQSA